MDDKRFDDVTRALGSNTSRRSLLRILGGALGAAFGAKGAEAVAQPGCRKEGHPCEGNQECCAGLVCVEAAGPGQAARCVKKGTTTTKKPTTTTKKPTTTTTTKKPTTTTTTKKPTTTTTTTTTKKPTTTTTTTTTTTKKPTTTTTKKPTTTTKKPEY